MKSDNFVGLQKNIPNSHYKVEDYAEHLIQLQSLTKSLERALLHDNKQEAFKLSTDIVDASIKLQNWTFRNME